MPDTEQQDVEKQIFLDKLLAMDLHARTLKDKVPATAVKEATWQGLAFILDGVQVISAMEEVRELLPFPQDVTAVPGTKEWMLGVANIRGGLLPIVDLQHFIGGPKIVITDQSRVLVVRSLGASTGLLVSSVIGMRHFTASKQIANAHFEGALGKYVYDVFGLEEGTWPVFSMAGLLNDPRFGVAARM